jgi:hypothetical protein
MEYAKKSLAVALLLVSLPSLVVGLQLSNIKSSVRLRIRDTTSDTAKQQYSDSSLVAVINEGQRHIVNTTWLLSATTTFGLVSGVREYPLPSDLLVINRVTLSNKPLTEVTMQGLDADYSNWSVASSTPTMYYINRAVSTTSINIGFYALPSTRSVNSCVVYYTQTAPDLVNDTDVPFKGRLEFYQYHDLLIEYTAGMLWLMQGMPEFAKSYLELYYQKLDNMKKNFGNMPNFNPSMRGDRGPKQ